MKRIVLLICLIAVSFPAYAINRYDTARLTCNRIQSILSAENAAILRYQSPRIAQLTLYDRYVSNTRYCGAGTRGSKTSVPASDTIQCVVLECKPVSNSGENR